jgi:ELWxxDGT repeat protein
MRFNRLPPFWLSVCLTFGATLAAAQPAARVADVNTTREDSMDPLFNVQDFGVLGTDVYFLQDDGIHGLELWKSDGTAAGTVLLKDVCPGACSGRPTGVTTSNGALYFSANDGAHGWELWKSDGTPEGTGLLIDLKPGLPGSLPGSFRDVEGTLYFAADDGVHGSELWKTDGTTAGTQLVVDLWPGAEGSAPRPWLAIGGGRLLLSADDGVHGREPFTSDGTGAGTSLLKDIKPGPEKSIALVLSGTPERDALALGDGSFYFSVFDGVSESFWKSDGTGPGTTLLKDRVAAHDLTPFGSRVLFASSGLWITDGTEVGTVQLKDGIGPLQITPLGDKAFFSGSDPQHAQELWVTDGTSAGTALFKDINPGFGYGFPGFGRSVIRVLNGQLLFFAGDGVFGFELWQSDGTEEGTHLLKDIAPGPGWGIIYGFSGMTVVGGTAYFHGLSAHGLELWKSDGTEAGTAEVKNITAVTTSLPVSNGFFAGGFFDLGGKLLFGANDGTNGVEPWISNGTAAGTFLLKDLDSSPLWSNPFTVMPWGGRYLLESNRRFWMTDGTPTGTSSLFPVPPPYDEESPFSALGTIFFSGRDVDGFELWKTDGTAAGSSKILDLNPGPGGSDPSDFTPFNSAVLFTARVSFNRGLWRTDGTTPGTYSLTAGPVTDAKEITPLGSTALFIANVPDAGKEPCRTDGTPAGTVLLKDIRAGVDSSDPGPMVRLGSRALFTAFDDASGRELWASDGTEAGTILLADIKPGTGSGPLENPTWTRGDTTRILGSSYFFLADDGTHGFELWKTDGTPAGTAIVADLYPGDRSSDIDFLTAVGSRLFFVADDGVHGRELWVSDGTATGTRLVKDLITGAGSPVIQDLHAVGTVAVFSADDGVHGREMWRSNGTALGTFQVQDIASGTAPSSPMAFFPLGDQVYFAANDNVAGFELWKVPSASLLATFQDVPTTHFAWRFIEGLAAAGVTSGCGGGSYCPSSPVTRAEASVLLLASRGGAAPPPATGDYFDDVPANYWAAPWIEELAREGVVSGCATPPPAMPSPMFCPGASLTRAEMAVLLLGSRGITPPPATGTVFSDVPAGYWAAPWIEELARQGVTGGCGNGNYCPGQPVTRAQMAVFLVANFGLPLP